MYEHPVTDESPDFGGAARRPAQRPTRHHSGPPERHAILVDARFWAWLSDQDGDAEQADAAHRTLSELLSAHGSRTVRTLWFSDHDVLGHTSGLQHRRVPSNAQDRGVTMLRAIAHELLALADKRAVDRVLLVSDDDRLLLAVDQAQRYGLRVDMLVNAGSQDVQALWADEPGWASLLMQADRLLVLGNHDARVRAHRPRSGHGDPRPRHEPPSAEASGIIEDEILQWWDDEAPEQRDVWRQEVQAARGIPQELDRQLLLRISRRLGQALSPAEKSAMRHQVRQQVLGPESGGAAPGAAAAQGLTRLPADA